MSLISSFSENMIEAGCDEAGRGCLAGPVVAAAVIFPMGYKNEMINDSKKLNHHARLQLRDIILKEAVSVGVGIIEPEVIDKINILNASILAMHQALNQLTINPEFVIVDGNRFKPYNDIPFKTIVKGDALYLSIAAASIIAKTTRDELMEKLESDFPQYMWSRNKGYPTEAHVLALNRFGPSPHHRKSFHVKRQLSIPFE